MIVNLIKIWWDATMFSKFKTKPVLSVQLQRGSGIQYNCLHVYSSIS